jgi:hypothetical protein
MPDVRTMTPAEFAAAVRLAAASLGAGVSTKEPTR